MLKMQKIGLKLIAGIGAVIFLFLTVYSWKYTSVMYTEDEAVFLIKDAVWKNGLFLLCVITVSGLVYKLSAGISSKTINKAAIVLSVLLTLSLIFFIKSARAYAIADQAELFWAADKIGSGESLNLSQGQYFSIYPFQLGLANIYAFFCRIGGEYDFRTIQYLHGLCIGLTVLFGFLLSRELFNDRGIECLYLFYSISFVPIYLYSLYIYGETIGVFGAVTALYFFVKATKVQTNVLRSMFWGGCAASIAMLCAYVARSALIIVWIAMMIIQLLQFLKDKKGLPLIMLAVMLIITLGGQRLIIHSVEKRESIVLDHGMPIWLWIAMGLQQEEGKGAGSYNAYNLNVFEENEYNQATSAKEAQGYIKRRFNEWKENPKAMIRFWEEKIANQWNEPSYGAFTMTRFMNEPERWVAKVYYGKGHDLIYSFLNRYQTMIYSFIFGYFIILLTGKRDTRLYLIGLILIGGFLFSIIWEAKSRYIYPYIVIAMPCVAGSAGVYCGKAIGCFTKYCSRNRIKESDCNSNSI